MIASRLDRPGAIVSRVTASGPVDAPPSAVFAFLADAGNHRLLTGRRVRLLEITETDDGRIRGAMLLRGPMLIRRRAYTRVVWSNEPSLLAGTARVGAQTRAIVRWELEQEATGHTRVALAADVFSAGLRDRLMLCLGGHRWLRTLFAQTIELLAIELGKVCPEPGVN